MRALKQTIISKNNVRQLMQCKLMCRCQKDNSSFCYTQWKRGRSDRHLFRTGDLTKNWSSNCVLVYTSAHKSNKRQETKRVGKKDKKTKWKTTGWTQLIQLKRNHEWMCKRKFFVLRTVQKSEYITTILIEWRTRVIKNVIQTINKKEKNRMKT